MHTSPTPWTWEDSIDQSMSMLSLQPILQAGHVSQLQPHVFAMHLPIC